MINMLNKFMQEAITREVSKNTIILLEQTLGKAQSWLGKPLENATNEEIMKYIDYIKVNGMVGNDEINIRKSRVWKEGRKLKKSSIWTVETKLVQFFEYCFDETDDPKYHKVVKKLKNIKVDKPKNDISPQDILYPEDIKKIINVATLERDRCLIAVLFESGLRVGELIALTNQMVQIDDDRKEVIFNIPNQEGCKTGKRTVVCLEVHGYVQDWMKCNPSNRFMNLTHAGIRKAVKRLFVKAGINKKCNPHMFRHSSITNAVIMKMQTNQISMRYWGIPNSNMLPVYLHLSEQIVNSGYRDAKGMGNSNGNIIINPIASRCVECGKLIQVGNICKSCNDTKKLKEENCELKKQMDAMKKMFNEDALKAMIETGVKEIMNKT
ncbi:Tyrosine recombinase XerA [uncultured archaeon]|nr:Tyrosine recombinase XerA [uncultured archaeon]